MIEIDNKLRESEDNMYTLETAEKEIRAYTELILDLHDMNIHRNNTNRKICDKIIEKCMNDLANPKLLKLFTNRPQLEYFVRQTVLYLILQ